MSRGNIDQLDANRYAMEAMRSELLKNEERKIITEYAAARKIEPQGMNSTINILQAAKALQIAQTPQQLVIANAATAAVLRKEFSREEVEIIITPAVETLTAYVVKDEELKQQLLASIEKRGY